MREFISVLPEPIRLGLSALVWRYFDVGAYISRQLKYGPTIESLTHILSGRLNELRLRNGFSIQAGGLKISLMELFVNIWLKQVYTPPGYEINAREVVFDIGTNIGMFSLFAAMQDPSVKVYAFEPVPRELSPS